MLLKIRRIAENILYHPVKARVLYDFVSGLYSIVPLLILSSSNSLILTAPILLFPSIYVSTNYAQGLYSKHKTASLQMKSFILLLSVIFSFFSLIFFIPEYFQLLLVSSLFLFALSILPRLFLNFHISKDRRIYINTIVSTKLPILVVGGGGYIGSCVVEKLLQQDKKVRVFDKFVYGRSILNEFKNESNLEIIEGDIGSLFYHTLALNGVRSLVHLAGLVGDPACSVDEKLTRHVNIITTRMLKETAKAFNIPRFVFASSCSVYGSSDEKVNEGSNLNPVSLYAQTKIDSERELLQDVYDDFHPVILRFATVFGHSRRMRFDLVVNLFVAQAYHNGIITVTGSQQWRPFIHVQDVAEAIVRATLSSESQASRQIFNVGDNKLNITIGDLAQLVASVVKKSKKGNDVRVIISEDKDDIRNYNVAFNKINKTLGFRHTISLKKGIKEMHTNMKKDLYHNPFKEKKYSNVKMTELLKDEFYKSDYQKSHFSALS